MYGSIVRRTVAAFAFVLLTTGAAFAQSAPITAIIVRHAEKVDDSADPLLSEAGNARARALADALADAHVSAILTTQYQRTRLTAAPLGERTGLAPIVVAASGANHAAEVAARILEQPAGSTVLVVGHSNTVPQIIRALGGPDVGRIEDSEYGNLFVVRISGTEVTVIRGRY